MKIGARLSVTTAATNVSMHIRFGRPAEALAQVAVDYDGDVIVVGTHGRRGFEKLMLGSVAERVLHIAHCPVLVARPKDYRGLPVSDRVEQPRSPTGYEGSPRDSHVYVSTQTLLWHADTEGIHI